jgi:uncharacterized membrane protein YagU involved in acid resistance
MKNAIVATLLGGLAAGALDIIYAFIVYGPLAPTLGLSSSLPPETVLQSVAGGWIGRDAAFDGGLNTALLGAATHFGIAIVMAGVFVAVLGRVGAKSPLLWGVLYGLVLFVVMNYVVVPLSAAATGQFAASASDAIDRIQHALSNALQFKRPLLLAGTIFTHTVLVGVPIALANARFNTQQA